MRCASAKGGEKGIATLAWPLRKQWVSVGWKCFLQPSNVLWLLVL